MLALNKPQKVDRLMGERILKGVLHNESEQVILITLSDKIKTETLKKIYNLLLDEELKSNDKETKNG